METPRRVRGTELRYLLSWILGCAGHAMPVAELLDEISMMGFDVGGRPSKTVSDALRWEMRLGRVIRCGRNQYRGGYVPRGTEYRIRQRVLALRAEAVGLSLIAGQNEGRKSRRNAWDARGA